MKLNKNILFRYKGDSFDKKVYSKIKDKLVKGWNYYDAMARSTMVDKIEYELGEMENSSD